MVRKVTAHQKITRLTGYDQLIFLSIRTLLIKRHIDRTEGVCDIYYDIYYEHRATRLGYIVVLCFNTLSGIKLSLHPFGFYHILVQLQSSPAIKTKINACMFTSNITDAFVNQFSSFLKHEPLFQDRFAFHQFSAKRR